MSDIPMQLRPKNWSQFQHYRNRKPAWIKLHRELLNDCAFMMLQDASALLAMFCWLLASEGEDGTFSSDLDQLAFRLHRPKDIIAQGLRDLIDAGFLEAASKVEQSASKVYQDASPEKEKRRGTEKEKSKKRSSKSLATNSLRPDSVPEQVWDDWVSHRRGKRAKVNATVVEGFENEAKKAGISLTEAMKMSVVQGWQGFQADWVKGNGKSNMSPADAGAVDLHGRHKNTQSGKL